jgi:hypothetical protein
VFEVAHIIDLDRPLRIGGSYLTIAGQTSPGGITIRGYPVEVVNASNIVVRYVRFRPGDVNAAGVPGKPSKGNGDLVGDAADALSILSSEHVIVDHVSASWSMDETLSVTNSADVTVQHSIISESLNQSFHTEGRHGYGSLVRGTGERGYTFWGNLWAHHQRRMPGVGGQQNPPAPGEVGQGIDLDMVGNVVYDWSGLPTHFVEDTYQIRFNLEANTYIPSPTFSFCLCVMINFEATADELHLYRSGNVFDPNQDGIFDPRPLIDSDLRGPMTEFGERLVFDRPQPPVTEAAVAYDAVLSGAGASLHRDAIDARVVSDVIGQTGGIIDTQAQVGGWPATPGAPPSPADLDRDGMSDDWERSAGLDPTNPTDHPGYDLTGCFTNLEVYLDGLVNPAGAGWPDGCCAPGGPCEDTTSTTTTMPTTTTSVTSTTVQTVAVVPVDQAIPAIPVATAPRFTG